jgi:hypothetical protein
MLHVDWYPSSYSPLKRKCATTESKSLSNIRQRFSMSDLKSKRDVTVTHSLGRLPTTAARLMWDLWWNKWRWGRFSPSTSVFHTSSHSISFFIFIDDPVIYDTDSVVK